MLNSRQFSLTFFRYGLGIKIPEGETYMACSEGKLPRHPDTSSVSVF